MSRASIPIKGIDVHFDGDSPDTIVMLHGWPDSHRLWDGVVPALQDRYCCVRFTLPGFDIASGPRATSLDDMCELLQTIVDEVSPGVPVTLMLHDWGCVFGYEYAARFPQRVARIVAVDIGDHASGAFRRSLSVHQQWQIASYQIWLALAWKLGGSLGTWMTRWMARQLRCRTDPATLGWQMNYPYAMRWFGSAGGFKRLARMVAHCPILYLYGERKPFMFHSPQWLTQLAQRPGCAVQAFPTGHWVMVQRPQEFNRCVRDWLVGGDEKTPGRSQAFSHPLGGPGEARVGGDHSMRTGSGNR